MFMVEMGQSSTRGAAERPRAKSLAEKIYKEIEPKRGSLGGIARLMRLESLHTLWRVNGPKKWSSDSYQKNNVTTNIKPNRELYGGRSKGRSPMKQQEFNDADEEPEFVNRRRSSRWSESSMLTKSDMALIRQNLAAKHVSNDENTDKKLQESKGLDDTFDMLVSKDLLVESIKKPNSYHFRDQRVNHNSSLGNRTKVMEPSNSAKYEGNAKVWIPDGDIIDKHGITSHPKRVDGLLLEPHNRLRSLISHEISDIQLEEKNKKNISPTPIVILKPNPRKMQSAVVCGLSSYHSHGYVPNLMKMKEHPSLQDAKEVSWRRKGSYYDMEFSKPVSNEVRKLAREITRRIRDTCDGSKDVKYSGIRELMESSYDANKSDFNSGSEMYKWSSGNSSVADSERGRHTSSGSVSKEGKKRLSERWKITHRYQDLEIVDKTSTLGQMLDIHDGETRSKNYAYKGDDGSSTQLGMHNGSSIRGGPLGITSGSSLKSNIQRTSSRSRSLPPVGGKIHSRDTCHDVLAEEKHLIHGDPISSGRSKGYPIHKDFLSSQGQSSKSRSKKLLPCPPIYIKEMDNSLEASFAIQMEPNIKDFSEEQLVFEMAEKDDCSQGPVSDIMIAEQGITTLPSKCSQLHPKQSSVDNESSAADGQEDFYLQGPPGEGSPSLQYLVAEPVSLGSSKDADRASPVSVFEVPSVEDASSSSESFERVGAEMNELRMQLQFILKMEYGAIDEILNLIPMEKDDVHSSSRAEGWEVSYILDVLVHSDCPLDPSLFDNIEKKYSDEMTGLRSERRLLFDRINSVLLKIFQKRFDSSPWVMPKLAGVMRSTWQKERTSDALEKLISQESANGSTEEIVLVGNEIEKLLIDEMIMEFLRE